MFSLKADDIYDVVKPFHFFSQLIGFNSFLIKREKGKFKEFVMVRNVFTMIISILFSIYVAVDYIFYGIDARKAYTIPMSDFYNKVSFCLVVVFVTISIIANLWSFKERKSFCHIFNLLNEIDEKFVKLQITVNLKCQKCFVLRVLFGMKTFLVFVIFATFLVGKLSRFYKLQITDAFAIFLSFDLWFFINFQFVFLIYLVKLRFEKINLYLRQNFLELKNENIIDGNEKLNEAAKIHDKLVDISDLVNQCCGFSVSFLTLF